ncbi:response regulator transcription factor [Shewanella amazonensis]|uniref:Response regulator receiver protein n=1 Tax=Shewanella amazonensis (strain ATCC BAA-1098 / SB2B) TaxID=326297 RepID=A1S6S2_SHEAM|nr:response regulator transcription factor [Shewanella amazonensis]ABM00079.1 response regulator receiver protein [Shewanella amazonensis SB2B]
MKSNNSVVLVDDHELVRAGIRTLLHTIDSIEVIGECGDGLEAVALVRRLKPKLLVLDISIKSLSGMEVVKLISNQAIPVKILILSMHNNVEYVAKCLKNGAHGYLLKDAAVDELEPAITNVLLGHSYISKEIDISLLEQLLSTNQSAPSLLELLTNRQKQILQLIAEGYSTRQIAESISVSIKTVETHRAHIMARLQIFDIAGLVRFALQEKLIP